MKNAKVVLKNRTSDIDKTLSEFDSVSLKDMKSASLMDRAETKYVVNHDLLLKILPRMIEGYNVSGEPFATCIEEVNKKILEKVNKIYNYGKLSGTPSTLVIDGKEIIR